MQGGPGLDFEIWEIAAGPVYSTQSMSTRTDTILATILAKTRATVATAKKSVPLADLERRIAHRPRGWAAALRRQAAVGTAVLAEIKKASPSKGLIRAEFDPAWLDRSRRGRDLRAEEPTSG